MKIKEDIKNLHNLFKENSFDAWSSIRELSFAVVMKDYSEHSKQTAYLNRGAYGKKDQEKLKNGIARLSGYIYKKENIISNEDLDDFFYQLIK